ncbi:MAG TPA: hypothetical protein VGC99_02945 [Candidatus Tectomicrobia bacterium]
MTVYVSRPEKTYHSGWITSFHRSGAYHFLLSAGLPLLLALNEVSTITGFTDNDSLYCAYSRHCHVRS